MRILYVAMKYDYGDARRGYSFEHHNFFDFFQRSGHDVLYFDSRASIKRNKRLLETARSEKPDLMFSVLFTNELAPAVIRQISNLPDTTTVNWFCDDHWRFDNYSRYWAPCFNWVVTTAGSALPKYAQLQYPNVIKSQWACNHLLYRKLDLPLQYDVTFVGQPHGNRRQIVDALRRAGIRVQVFGFGWEAGRVSQEQMIRIFNQSRINLNFSNASVRGGYREFVATGLSRLARPLDRVPLGQKVKKAGRQIWNVVLNQTEAAPEISTYTGQIKGRHFEVPGCGGFLLTGNADDLDSYYEPGKEVVCFDSTDDLIEKIRYYLAHEEERASIAQAGRSEERRVGKECRSRWSPYH